MLCDQLKDELSLTANFYAFIHFVDMTVICVTVKLYN